MFAIWLGISAPSHAHESHPAVLEIRQVSDTRYEVLWQAPIYMRQPHPASVELPASWRDVEPATTSKLPDADLFRRVVDVGAEGIEGSEIRFPGLGLTTTDVFVRIKPMDGSFSVLIVRPTDPAVRLAGKRSWTSTAGEFVSLGFHHILMGVDHLLFVLGLLLIVRDRMMLLKTITAFTLAHSITLAVATLGVARAPLEPLNAAIALSILFLGPEIVRAWNGETSLTIRYPWIVAFVFGLLHGFGFASGLSTTGMTGSEIPWALLWFNIGVELGQVAFVLVALALQQSFRVLQFQWPKIVARFPGYAVGVAGAYWFIQRMVMMVR
jgi:hydrogenase/urease accessory protein HupE